MHHLSVPLHSEAKWEGLGLGLLFALGTSAQSRPNIVLILADDMGYSDLGCYGSEIETPNLDGLAQNGLRWRQFYNGARSCPTRASLLTGLYAHQAGIGWMTHANMGRPAYQGYLNDQCVTMGDVLRSAGYGTYISGKWHVSSVRQNSGKIQDNWPNQRGFDQFFGIVEGASNYYHALLNRNNEQFQSPEEGFYLTHAITDSAAVFIRQHDYQQHPLFLYLAYNAPHWPLHALPQDVAKYREMYRRGWDVIRQERFERQLAMGLFPKGTELPARDPLVPAWDSLSPEEQANYADRMAVYAAQVDAMDQGIGRVVEALRQSGQLDNTIILFLSDNGACAEHIGKDANRVDGSNDTYESYRRAWANVSSTPYREYKHHTNEGGIASPLIVHYPQGIKRKLNGTFVDEYGHITDLMATFVQLSGAHYPTEHRGHRITPMEGVSLVPNLQGKRTGRGRTYWEHEANIAVRDGRWKLVTKTLEGRPYSEDSIRLYDMKHDPTEQHDLAARYPRRKQAMYADWTRWAERVGALPMDTREYGWRGFDFCRAMPNGDFDDNFGDWTCFSGPQASLTFDIDRVDTIQGKTAHITIAKPGPRPASGYLKWDFSAKKGEEIVISFQARASRPTTMYCRLEDADRVTDKPIDESVALLPRTQQYTYTSRPLSRDGHYQLVFYMGQSEGEIWIDQVRIEP